MLGEDFGVKKIHSINRRMFIIGAAKFVIFTGIIARLFSLQITNKKSILHYLIKTGFVSGDYLPFEENS
jgi:penicillin-binding protein 2